MQLQITPKELSTLRAVNLKIAINNLLNAHRDQIGYGSIKSNIFGWELEIFYTPHSNNGLNFCANNGSSSSYFKLDEEKLDLGYIVLFNTSNPNPTAQTLLHDYFKSLLGL